MSDSYALEIAELAKLITSLDEAADEVREANKNLAAHGQLNKLGNDALKNSALRFDPAPGELAAVDTSAEQYRTVSTRLASALIAIQAIVKQTGVWEGEASEAFARRLGDLPDYLDTASDSMARAAAALTEWSAALGGMQQQARDLEARARAAREEAEAARDNPAFGLANQTFTDPESLHAAQRALDAAAQQLTRAIDNLEAIIEAAQRLHGQHCETAERVAALLDRARELAPDEPGLLGKTFEAIGDFTTELANDAIDLARDTNQMITDFLEDNANLIKNVSDVLADVSTMLGVVGDFLPPPPGPIIGLVSTGIGLAAVAGHTTAWVAGGDDVITKEARRHC